MAFFGQAISTLSTLVIALGAGLGVWGVVNLLEGYGQDNPGAKSQGVKQLMAGGGVILIGVNLVPLGFQGFLIMVCVGIYAVLVQTISTGQDIHAAIWGCAGYTLLLCFALFKTGGVAKSVFGAH